jgi:glycosyltransferase involved in cell wall biosynthesis
VPRVTRPPAVSIVVPARNPGPYLRPALDSVVAQTFADWELVVVDDGSTEDLAWVGDVDPRVRWERVAPRGVSIARNVGIMHTTGDLVAFLDADDVWRPEKLARQLAVMEGDVPYSYTGFDLIDEHGTRLCAGYGRDVDYVDMLAGELGMLQSSVVARRDALLVAGLYDPMVSYQEDLDLFLRLARIGRGVYLDSVEVGYRQHGANTTTAYWDAMWALLGVLRVHETVARRDHDARALAAVRTGRRAVRKTYGYQAIDSARAARRDGRHRDAMVALARASYASPAAISHAARRWIVARGERSR